MPLNSAAEHIAQPATRTWHSTVPGRILLALGGSLFVALCAHVSVPLPFTPVPLTLGDFAVLLVGLTLGPVTGFCALALYLAEGACGLPVFNPGGPGGLLQLLGFTGGYLAAYPFAAAVAGAIYRGLRTHRNAFLSAATGAALATTLVLLSGVAWLASVHHLAFATAFRLGALPFLPGQLVKVASAAGIVSALRPSRS